MAFKNYKSEDLIEVLHQIGAGEEKAIENFYHFHYNRFIKFGNTITEDQPTIEDCIQNILIWFVENPRQIKKLDRPDIYFYRALRNNLVREQNLHRKNLKKELDETLSNLLIVQSPEKKWMDSEAERAVSEELRREIEQLPDYLRQTLYLRYFSDLSYEDISHIMEIKSNVARIYVHRAIARLRRTLQKLQPLYGLMFLFSLLSS